MKELGCCFTGHRDIDTDNINKIENKLNILIQKLVDKGIHTYYTGGAYGFDEIAALAVLNAKKANPQIKLILVIPCKDQTKYWQKSSIEKYNWIKNNASNVIVLSQNYYRGCMQLRNRYLVNHSDICVCYLKKDNGGTAYTVNYAKKKGIKIINLNTITPPFFQAQ